MRLKVGKKSYYLFCWSKWIEYNSICRRIKEAIDFHFYNYKNLCFAAWKEHILNLKNNKEAILKRFYIKYGNNSSVHSTFTRWITYTNHNKEIKLKFRRIFQNPHFFVWTKYVAWNKHVKSLHKAAKCIQAKFRSFIKRKKFITAKKAVGKMKEFCTIVLSNKFARLKRNFIIQNGFKEWLPFEIDRRLNKSNEGERQRLIRRQNLIQEKEKISISELKKHLRSPDGKLQLNDLVQELTEKNIKEFVSLSRDKRINFAKNELITKCSNITRQTQIHDFNAKFSPFITCPDPSCCTISTTELQYHSHVLNSEKHIQNDHQFSEFHIMLKHKKGQESLKKYFLNNHGVSTQLNCLEAWISIQDWKKIPSSRKEFISKAINIFEMYLINDAPRKIDVNIYDGDDIINKMQAIKLRDHEGFYQLCVSKRSSLRQLLGMAGKEFVQWTDQFIVSPMIFNSLEWKSFLYLYKLIRNDPKFKESEDYRSYVSALNFEK
jgi:hypothetical protein